MMVFVPEDMAIKKNLLEGIPIWSCMIGNKWFLFLIFTCKTYVVGICSDCQGNSNIRFCGALNTRLVYS